MAGFEAWFMELAKESKGGMIKVNLLPQLARKVASFGQVKHHPNSSYYGSDVPAGIMVLTPA